MDNSLLTNGELTRNLFYYMNEAFAIGELILDSSGKPDDYRHLEVNPAFEKIIGQPEAQIRGKTWRELGHIDPNWLELFGQVVTTGRSASQIGYSSSYGKWFDLRAFSLGAEKFAFLLMDITERQQENIFGEALQDINEIVYSKLKFDEIMNKIIIATAKNIGCETAAISLCGIGPGTSEGSFAHCYGFPEEMVTGRMNNGQDPFTAIAVETKLPIIINDAFYDQRVNREQARKWNIRSVMAVPLIIEDQGIGAIFFNYHKQVFNFSPSYIEFATKLAASISLAIKNAQLFDRVRQELNERRQAEARVNRQNMILNTINRIYQEAIRCETLEDLGRVCLEIIESVTGSKFSFIGAIGPDGLLHVIAISNPGWEQCKMQSKTGHRRIPGDFNIHGIYGRVLLDGRSLLTNEPFAHPDSIGVPEGHPALSAFLGTPFVQDGKVLGMVGVGNRGGGYRTEDQEILESLTPTILQVLLRKQAEEAFRESEEKYRELVETSNSIILRVDKDTNITFMNQFALRFFGYTEAEIIGKNVIGTIIPPSDTAGQDLALMAEDIITHPEKYINNAHENMRKNGELVWVTWSNKAVYDHEGNLIEIRSVGNDITKLKQMETALQKSEGGLLNLIKYAPAGIYEVDFQNQRFISVNDVMCQLLGYTREELLEMNPFDILDEDSKVTFQRRIHQRLTGEKPDESVEYIISTKDGRFFNAVLNVTFSSDENGKPVGAIVIAHDITERKLAEIALKRNEQHLNEVLSSIQDGFFELDREWKFTYINQRAARNGGFEPEELIGESIWDKFPYMVQSKFEEVYREVMESRRPAVFEIESMIREQWYEVSVYPSVAGISGFWRDITQRKRLEANLRSNNESLNLLKESATLLLSNEETDKIIQTIAEKVMRHLQCDVFFNFIVDENQGRLRLNAYSGVPAEGANSIQWLDMGVAICGCVGRDGCRIVSENIPENGDPRADLVRSLGIRAYACHPLHIGEKTIGTLSFGTRSRTHFNEDELEVMRMVADQVSVAKQRKRSEDALRQFKQKFTEILENIDGGFITYNTEWQFTHINTRAAKNVGYEPAELIGKNIWEVSPKISGTPMEAYYRKAMTEGVPVLFEEHGTLTDRWYQYDLYPTREGIVNFWYDITERKRAEKALQMKQAELTSANEELQAQTEELNTAYQEMQYRNAEMQAIFSTLQDAVLIYDTNRNVVQANSSFLTTYKFDPIGLNVKEIIQRVSCRNLDGSPVQLEEQPTPKALRGEIVSGIQLLITRDDGAERIVETSSGALRSDERIIGSVTVWHDITELKQLEEELKRANDELEERVCRRTEEVMNERQRLYDILETLPGYVILLDKDYRVPFANKIFRDRFGESRGRRCYEYLFKKDAPCENCETYKVLETNAPHRWEWTGPDDRNYDIYDYPFTEIDGSIMILEMGIDITERKRAETIMQEERKRLFDVLETLPTMVCLLTPDYYIAFANRSFREKFGALSGRPCYEYCFGNNKPCEFCESYKVLETGQPHHWQLTGPDGSAIEAYDFPFTDVNGLPMILEMDIDITERVKYEGALAKERELLMVTLDSLTEGVIAIDSGNRIFLMNEAALNLTGYTKLEAIDEPLNKILNLIDEKTGAPVIVTSQNSLVQQRIPLNVVLVTQHLKRIPISLNCSLIKTANDNDGANSNQLSPIIGTVIVFQDITEKQKTEQELLKADKLESLGILAGGIAHDFNNLLAAILSNIQLAQMKYKKNLDIESYLRESVNSTHRASELTRQLLTFAKGGAPLKKAASLAELIRDTAHFALRGAPVKVECKIAEDLWPVEADSGQMSQVIHNLVINANQAMPKGGKIEISAENTIIEPKQRFHPGNYIKITIKDQGTGIPRENLTKIFDPFFTTKREGSGLGLATSYSIIRQHDGYVEVESEVSVGTTFYIYLPALTETVILPETQKELAVTREGLRILLMDDEEVILKSVQEMLENYGHEVMVAMDGDKAIKVYKQAYNSGAPFDIVIMDLTVPGGMGGQEAISHLQSIDPKVKAIVSSGYANDPIIAEHQRFGFCGVVTKPYKFDELNEVLSRVAE